MCGFIDTLCIVTVYAWSFVCAENCKTSKEYGMMGMDSAEDNSVSHRCLGEGEELQL